MAGGNKAKGSFFEPTVLVNVPQDCVSVLNTAHRTLKAEESQLISGEETFGPLAALIKFKTEDEVIVSYALLGSRRPNADQTEETCQ